MDQPKHPYLLALFGLGLLLVIAVVVQTHMPVRTINTTGNWGTPIVFSSSHDSVPYRADVPVTPPTQAPQNTPINIPGDQNLSSFSYDTTPAPAPTVNTAATIINSDTSFDFNAFMQQLTGSAPTKGPAPSAAPSIPDFGQEVYATVPTQLFSTVGNAPPARTDLQQSIYLYGNTVGSFIQNYDRIHPNDAAEVQRYFDSRDTVANVIALKQLGDDLKNIGISMQGISGVPSPIVPAHTALAESYIDIGTKLSALTAARTDEEIVKAINVYDDAVEIYAKNYTALIFRFAEQGVRFRPDEPGSLFMFTP